MAGKAEIITNSAQLGLRLGLSLAKMIDLRLVIQITGLRAYPLKLIIFTNTLLHNFTNRAHYSDEGCCRYCLLLIC